MVMAAGTFDNIAPVDLNNRHIILKKVNSLLESQHGAKLSKQLVGEALRRRVEGIDHEYCEPGEEDTFFVADLGEVYRQHMRWKLNLPRVKPFYGTCSTAASPFAACSSSC